MPKTFTAAQRAKAQTEILSQVAMGKSLRSICESGDDWTPAEATFRDWVREDPDLAAQYASARETRADVIADEVMTIADAATPDTVNVARLQIDTRKWMAGKLRPKVYGDKVAIGGADDLPPIKTEDVSGKELLRAHIAAITSRTTGGNE